MGTSGTDSITGPGLGEGVLGGKGMTCMGGGGDGENTGLGYLFSSGGGKGLGGGQTTKVLSASVSVVTKDGLRPRRSSRSAVWLSKYWS